MRLDTNKIFMYRCYSVSVHTASMCIVGNSLGVVLGENTVQELIPTC